MSEEKKITWDEKLMMAFFSLVDSVYFPWILVAVFVWKMFEAFLGNLESEDIKELYYHMLSWKTFFFVGWLMAFIQIPITMAVYARQIRNLKGQLNYERNAHDRTAERVRQYEQSEFSLETEKAKDKDA